MNNSEYWKKRFEILEKSAVSKGASYYSSLEEEYRRASKSIESEISTWYTRFTTNNQITLSEARKLLNSSELAEFKWTVQEYIKFGEENALNGQWMKQLENASARVHISRLEALKVQMQQQMEVLYGNQTDGIDTLARKIYSDGYYHTAFEIQKGFNVGWDLQSLNEKQLSKVLNKPWTADNQTFRDKCWKQKTDLVSTVSTELTQAIMRGDSPDKAIKTISEKFDVAKNKAGRLVMTELAFFASEAQKDCFNELNVERFEIVATLDSHTSQICQDLDGQVFDMKDFQAGVTAPPFHPWCRSTTVPYFEDNFTERAARDAEGNTYYVPSTMKYADWKESFVDGGSKADLKNAEISDIIKERSAVAKEIIERLQANNVEYNPVKRFDKPLSNDEIVDRLAGGDMTKGSCSSLAFSYIGNKNGIDVLDFRGGSSQYEFSLNTTIQQMLKLPGIKGSITEVEKEIQGAISVLNSLELNKEYYLAVGKHAAIVRRLDDGLQYLELQSHYNNGWTSFESYGSIAKTLNKRFGCRKTVNKSFGMVWKRKVVLMDVDSFNGNSDFEEILGYINTAVDAQKKGVMGGVK